MNKRIDNLIEECTSTYTSYDFERGASEVEYFDKEKFAELIVKECADISNQAEKQCQHPGTQILKHLGVEE